MICFCVFPGVGGGGGGDPIPVTDCLLCGHHSSNVERNVIHMTTCSKGSFFLPDADYIVGLVTNSYSVDFSKPRINVKKCVFNKRTIKVCVSLLFTVSWELRA